MRVESKGDVLRKLKCSYVHLVLSHYTRGAQGYKMKWPAEAHGHGESWAHVTGMIGIMLKQSISVC